MKNVFFIIGLSLSICSYSQLKIKDLPGLGDTEFITVPNKKTLNSVIMILNLDGLEPIFTLMLTMTLCGTR